MAGTVLVRDNALSITLHFVFQDVAADATNVLTLSGGGAGFKVPTGYRFHAVCLHAESDTDLTAGTITFKVRRDGTALSNGPEVELSDAVQAGVDTEAPGTEPIAAGSAVAVQAAASAALAPATCGVDVILSGLLLPAY